MNASLEHRHFVASDSDYEKMARDYTASLAGQAVVSTTFLRCMIAGTQSELKAEVRIRSRAERNRISDPTVTRAHLAALEAVYTRAYAAIVKALGDAPVDPDTVPKALSGKKLTKKAVIQWRATKFRSSKAALRAWIRAGYDVTGLAAGSTSRTELGRDVAKVNAVVPSGLDRVAKRSVVAVKRLVGLLQEVAKYDPARAEALMKDAAGSVMALSNHTETTTSMKKAAEKSMPLDVGSETFILLPFKQPEKRAA